MNYYELCADIHDGNHLSVRQLILQGYDINAEYGPLNRTLLQEAIHSLNPEIINVIIEYGADVNRMLYNDSGCFYPLDLVQILYYSVVGVSRHIFEQVYNVLLDAGAYQVRLKLDDYLIEEIKRRRIDQRVKACFYLEQVLPEDLTRMIAEMF